MPLPSVRNVAAENRINPLTVLKAYQQLVDEQLVEKRRGLGMYVNDNVRGAAARGRAPALPREGMAARSANHPAPRPLAAGTARGRKRTARERKRREGLKRWPASKQTACARVFGKTVALDGIDLDGRARAASSG